MNMEEHFVAVDSDPCCLVKDEPMEDPLAGIIEYVSESILQDLS